MMMTTTKNDVLKSRASLKSTKSSVLRMKGETLESQRRLVLVQQ